MALHEMQRNGASYFRVGSLMVFVELQREAEVCYRVTAGEDIKNFGLFSDVRIPI